MKITKITTYVVNMPLRLDGDVPHVGGRARTALEMLLVRIDADEGITGLGRRLWPSHRVGHSGSDR
ncbi:MAG: hypothetical protein ACXWIT_22250 [Burkholderiales bacterium]